MSADKPTIEALVDALQSEPDDVSSQPNWQPPYCGELDLRIKKSGEWYYQGSAIKRQALVKLFAKVLHREGEDFFLSTPTEKFKIQVDDAPFIAITLDQHHINSKQYLYFTTNTDEEIIASRQHPIFVNYPHPNAEPSPYIQIRQGLNARLNRSVFYQLVDYCIQKNGQYTVTSDGCDFSLGAVVH